MYKELRTSIDSGPATTPESWASNFADSTVLGSPQRLAFRLDHRWRLIRQFVRPGGRVLDAGAGAGEWVAFLNEQGFAAEGLDYSPTLVGRTRVLYPDYKWEVGTVQRLPYPDDTFDAVISWGVIEHDEVGPGAALAEFRRVLRDDGIAIVTVPIDNERQRRASQAHFPESSGDHSTSFFQYFMTVDELSAFVRDAGLTVVGRGLQHSPALSLLAPKLSSRLTTSMQQRLNKLVRLSCWWHAGLRNMTYCIGRKPKTA